MLKNFEDLTDEQKKAAIFVDIYYKGKRRYITPYIKSRDVQGIRKMSTLIGIKGSEMVSWRDLPVDKRKEAIFSLNSDYVKKEAEKMGKETFIVQMAKNTGDNPLLIYRIAEILEMSVEDVYAISKGPERKPSVYDISETIISSERPVTFREQVFYVRDLLDIYEFVCLLPNMEDVMEFIKENQYTKIIFNSVFNEREFSRKFLILFGQEESKKMIDKIKQIYLKYKEIAIINKPIKERKPNVVASIDSRRKKALKIIRNYIDGNSDSMEAYVSKEGISSGVFENALQVVSENYPDIYKEYKEKEKMQKSIFEKAFNEQLHKISYLLENGVEMENGEKRPFDIVDYYQMITIHPRNIPKYFQRFDLEEDFKKFKKFIRFNSNYSLLNEERLKVLTHIIKKDGEEREITEQEKRAIVQYLIDCEIPIFTNTFDAAVRRYSMGYISLEGISNPNKA